VPQFKYVASGTYVIASDGTGVGEVGYQVSVTSRGWSGSVVFAQNIAPPGSVPSYVNVAYQDANTGTEFAAGTAITGTAAIIISPTVGDLIAIVTVTTGEVIINVNPATQGVTNRELRNAFLAAGYDTAGQNTTEAMLSVAGAAFLEQARDGAPLIDASGSASIGYNWTWNPSANAIASDLGACVISGGGNRFNPQLIGYTESRNRFNGDGVNVTFTTDFAVSSTSNVRVRLIRTDKVRVTVTSFCDITIVGGFAQIVYPEPGHFVNNATGGAEGTDPALLTTEQLEVVSVSAVENPGSLSNYSGIYGGYNNIIQQGVMQHVLGAHHRIVAGDHNTILGGSYARIDGGSYGAVIGGTANEASASGTGNAIVGGSGNTTSGSGPGFIFGGTGNVTSAAFATIAGGANNAVSGNGAFATGREHTVSGRDAFVGGYDHTVSAQYGFAAGLTNTVTGTYGAAYGRLNEVPTNSFASLAGGQGASARFAYGQTLASQSFAATGDAQTSVLVARVQTTDATPTALTIAGTTRISIPTDTTYCFSALVVARRTDADNESAGYKIEGVIDNNAGTTALVGSPTVTVLGEDTAAWDVAASADNTNDALQITVTGENAKTIRWVGRVTLVEVTG